MANHKSAIKRVRSNSKKKLLNRYQHKTARNSIRDFKEISKKKEALKSFPKLVSLIDKLSKKNIIHSNKAANLKLKLATHLAALK
jgi:small subunit ribosomal protein S20|tara:strand:+ start:46 stop:300 length:255 start_codon:yes stop_codon:yes gene_type:complete